MPATQVPAGSTRWLHKVVRCAMPPEGETGASTPGPALRRGVGGRARMAVSPVQATPGRHARARRGSALCSKLLDKSTVLWDTVHCEKREVRNFCEGNCMPGVGLNRTVEDVILPPRWRPPLLSGRFALELYSRLLLCMAAIATNACLTPDLLKGPTKGDSDPPEAFSGLSFRNTKLNGLFSRYPYDTTKPFDQQFPRVALTVIDAPQGHYLEVHNVRTRVCWKLRAKIWFSVSTSQNVESFHWCNPDDIAIGVPLKGADIWFNLPKSGTHTGNKRTDGFVPPEHPVPQDLRHQKLWRSADHFNTGTLNGQMLASLLYFMGFDWSCTEDRRVWVIEFIQAY